MTSTSFTMQDIRFLDYAERKVAEEAACRKMDLDAEEAKNTVDRLARRLFQEFLTTDVGQRYALATATFESWETQKGEGELKIIFTTATAVDNSNRFYRLVTASTAVEKKAVQDHKTFEYIKNININSAAYRAEEARKKNESWCVIS